MNARLSRIVSRLSLVSAVAISSAALAACSRAPATERTETAAADVKTSSRDRSVFREIEKIDLRDAQLDALGDVEDNLRADFALHRETVRQVAETLAAAVEVGKLDPEEGAAQRAALVAAAEDAKAAIATAMNDVHDVLDADQRAEIVERMRAKHEQRRSQHEMEGAEHKGSIARLALQIGLSAEQQKALHEGIRDSIDRSFPERKVRREEWESKSKALAEAFVRDDFSAEDHDLAGNVEEAISSFTDVAEQAIDVSGRVLGDSQRASLAAMIRERAAKL